MSKTLTQFIERQPLFFVATAARTGRVNLSPKGGDTLRVLSPNRILWLSLSGSGNETAGHIHAQNRITLMWCAFRGNALIVRAYGSAQVRHPRDPEWDDMIGHFPTLAGSRQIYDVSIDGVQTSCGSGVPEMTVIRDRIPEEMEPFYAEMGPEGLKDYWKTKNTRTIDGLPTHILKEPS